MSASATTGTTATSDGIASTAQATLLDQVSANTMVMQIEGMIGVDVAMVSDKAIDALVRDWGLVDHVELVADRGSFARVDTRYGPAMTMAADLEIVFTDHSRINRSVVVTASVEDGVFGFRSVSVAA